MKGGIWRHRKKAANNGEQQPTGKEASAHNIEDLPTFGLKTYCISPHYTVYSRIEDIYVSGDEAPGSINVGWFPGTPSDAAISGDEQWLVSVGHGFIAYRMQPPWRPYDSGPGEGQWFEGWREPGNELRFRSVQSLDAHNFLLHSIDNDFVVTECFLNADTQALTKVSEWVEEHERWRARVLGGFTDLQLMRIYGGAGRLVLEFRESGTYEDAGKYQVDLSGQIEIVDTRGTMDSSYSDTYDLQDVAQAARAKRFFQLHANGSGSIRDVPTIGCLQLLLKRRPYDSRDASGRALRDTPSTITLRARGRFASWLVRTPHGTLLCPGWGGWLEGPAQKSQEPTEKATAIAPAAVASIPPADFPQVPLTRDEIMVRLDAFLEAYQRDPAESGLYFVAPGLPGRHLAVFKRQSAFDLTIGLGFPNSCIATEPPVADSWLMQRNYAAQEGVWTRSSSISPRKTAAEILDLFQSAWGAMELEAPTLITGSRKVQDASRSFGQLALAPPGVCTASLLILRPRSHGFCRSPSAERGSAWANTPSTASGLARLRLPLKTSSFTSASLSAAPAIAPATPGPRVGSIKPAGNSRRAKSCTSSPAAASPTVSTPILSVGRCHSRPFTTTGPRGTGGPSFGARTSSSTPTREPPSPSTRISSPSGRPRSLRATTCSSIQCGQ